MDSLIPNLTGRQFEDQCKYRMDYERKLGRGYMWRCGVQSSFMDGEWKPIQSLPDFEGIARGLFFVLECKACSQASFPLDDDKFKRRQLRHMLGVAEHGGVSILAVHFNARELKRGHEPAETWAIPVSSECELWQAHDRGEVKRISRSECEQHGMRIEWNAPDGCRTARPDVLNAVIVAADYKKVTTQRGVNC